MRSPRSPIQLALAIATGGLIGAFGARTAEAGENEVTLGSTARSLRSGSANAVTPDGMASVSLTYARAVGLPTPGGVTLDTEVGFDRGMASGVRNTPIITVVAIDRARPSD